MVALRTREVGIRMAVGAQQQDVFWLILRESTQAAVAGLLAGTVLAAGVVYLLRGMLSGVNAVDGVYFVAVSLSFLVVALLHRTRQPGGLYGSILWWHCDTNRAQASEASGRRPSAGIPLHRTTSRWAPSPANAASGWRLSPPARIASVATSCVLH